MRTRIRQQVIYLLQPSLQHLNVRLAGLLLELQRSMLQVELIQVRLQGLDSLFALFYLHAVMLW